MKALSTIELRYDMVIFHPVCRMLLGL